MCGIAGVFGRSDRETTAAMLRLLAHRGPDDEYAVGDTNFTLGARRLSIVDVDHGRQPLSNEDGTIWAAQNGELYNFPRVRPQLVAEGHRFATHADTELLPHLYEKRGLDLPRYIDGMFAIAVWDSRNRVGLLARDRMGKKPLYYTRVSGALYFSSEIKSLLAIPGVERRINYEALHHYLSLKHVPHPKTIFEGIFSLPPAHRLTFHPGAEPRIERYWDLEFTGDEVEEEPAVEQLLRLLRQGVERRLMADVPVGFFLSGGIDSSLSTVLAAEATGQRLKTFTLTYGDRSTTTGKDEDRRWARWIADRWQTDHHEEEIHFSHFPENLRRIIRCFDEPFCGTISTYFLSPLIAKHVKVAVSGDGADELFGSYLSHRLAFAVANYGDYLKTGNSDLIRPFEEQPDYLARFAGKPDWEWRSSLVVFSEEEKQSLYAPDFAHHMNGMSTPDEMRYTFDRLTARDPLNRILEAEYRTIFPDQVLAFVDRLSMAHSLEVRTAYLDTDFVRFVAALPGRLKIRDGITKYILKKAALRYFPEEMVFRRKEGFVMPIADWLRRDLRDYVEDTLASERLALHGIFSASAVSALVSRMHDADSTYQDANKVFSILVFQEWYEQYMTAPVMAAAAGDRAC